MHALWLCLCPFPTLCGLARLPRRPSCTSVTSPLRLCSVFPGGFIWAPTWPASSPGEGGRAAPQGCMELWVLLKLCLRAASS